MIPYQVKKSSIGERVLLGVGILISMSIVKGFASSMGMSVFTATQSRQAAAVTAGALVLIAGIVPLAIFGAVRSHFKGAGFRKTMVARHAACGRCWGEFELGDDRYEYHGASLCGGCHRRVSEVPQ